MILKGWSTQKLMAIGALAVLRIVLSMPGMAIAGVTGVPFLKNITDLPVIAIMFAFVPLVTKQVGAATIWALTFGIISLPLPFIGPPGFAPKILVAVGFGIIADVTYLIFRRWERVAAVMIGLVQIGPGIAAEFGMWSLLGVPGLAQAAAAVMTPEIMVIASVVGGAFGFVGWLIYHRLERTAVVARIQARQLR